MAATILRSNHTYYKGKRAVGVRNTSNQYMSNPFGSNEDSFSPDRPEERNMHWTERAAIILPSGFTVGESWAALRKNWYGFKASLHDGLVNETKKYAFRINRIQKQLGIPMSDFTNMFSQEEFDRMEAEITGIGFELDRQRTTQVHEIAREIGLSERPMDYDGMMHDAHTEIASAPPPRPEIFVTYDVKEDRSCYEESAEPEPVAVHDTQGCFYEYKPAAFKKKKLKQKRLRKSCFYVSNKPLSGGGGGGVTTKDFTTDVKRFIK